MRERLQDVADGEVLAEQGHGYAMRRLPGFCGWKRMQTILTIMIMIIAVIIITVVGLAQVRKSNGTAHESRYARDQTDAVDLHGSQNQFPGFNNTSKALLS